MASITFEAAVELAQQAHASQVDQAGRPYLGHVLRLADAVRKDTERFAALIGDPSWPHRSGGDVARIAAFAGHSLRSGCATQAALEGAPERAIMRQGRWRSIATVRRYIRSGDLWQENASAWLGL
jgi:hypothetical protein